MFEMKKTKLLLSILILASALSAVSCNNGGNSVDTTSGDEVSDTENNLFDVETVTPDTTEPPVTDTETETEETEPPLPIEPEIINPLTGLGVTVDHELRRPVAIMINNIQQAIPQEGISYADVMYECIVEGGLTRLMMVVSDYDSLPTVGSVRSAREYYIDFAADYDAIFIHAGGSEEAYKQLKSRRVDYICGVNRTAPGMFYRDEWRRANLGYVHSLVTDGDKIVKGIEYRRFSTDIEADFDRPLDFVTYGTTTVPEGESGEYVRVTYNAGHRPYFEYNDDDGLYYRYQFKGEKHIDKGTNKQLAFTNVFVLYMSTINTGDSYKHVNVITTGSGEGYYFTMGKYIPIRWEKAGVDIPMKLYTADGEELLINRGKTFFQICSTQMKASTEIR